MKLIACIRAGVVFCLLSVFAGSVAGQQLVGTNAPGTARNYNFTLVAGVTNFSLVVSGNVSRFSHLLIRRGLAATDVDYDFASQWDFTTNSIYLERPEITPTNFSIRVRTPTNSLTHTFTVVLRTNTALFKTASKPVMKPLTIPPTAAWITNSGRHYYRFEMQSNTSWQVVLDTTNSMQPQMYLQYKNLPSETSYLKRSVNLTNDGFGLSDLESLPGTYYLGLFSDSAPVGKVRYTLRTRAITLTPLAWDPGLTHDGTLVYTNNSRVTNDYYFKITTINSPVGAWRTALKVTAGEADLYLSRGTLPTPANSDYRSTRAGSDGFVLSSTQFNPSEDWYILVRAWTNAQFTLVSGTPYVQDLGTVTADGSSGSGTVQVGPEGMRFFRASPATDSQAWRLWLSGATNSIFVKKSGVPLPVSFEQSNAVQMLVVPPYLIGGDQYFIGVNGSPGTNIVLDSREQPIIDLPYESSTAHSNMVNTYGYVTYRVQVPPQQIAWQISTSTTNGNPNVAVRRNLVPNENYNDAFSEQPPRVMDSIVLVPPVLSDGTFYITVYGTNNFHYVLQNGTPVVTDINYTSVTVNDDPTRVGWRFYRAADINQQLGSLGWELFLTNAPPGTRIALRRNAAPSIWNLRTPQLAVSNSYDSISIADYLQQPRNPFDVWYVGIYNPSNALGSFTLYTRELFADPISGDAQAKTRSNVQANRWEFFRITIPSDILGWDIRITNVIGAPRIVVSKEALPAFVGNGPWSPISATAWPSGMQWTPNMDWTKRQYAPDGVTGEDGRILAMGMGRPLDPGVYYIGVLSTNTASYTLVNRFIGPGYSIPVVDLNFNGGIATNTVGPRQAAYYRVITPGGIPSWKVKLTATSGDSMLVVSTNLIPHIEAEKRVQKSLQTRDEHFVLLPPAGSGSLWENTNYLVVVGEGQNPTNATRIGVGNSTFTIQSLGTMPEVSLGHLTTSNLMVNDTLQGGESKGYYFTSPPDLWGSWVTLENTIARPVMVVGGLFWCNPGEDRGDVPDPYGNLGGSVGLASPFRITILGSLLYQSVVVKARYNPANVWSNASYRLKVEPIQPEPIAFDGGLVHLSNMDPGHARYFVVTVPPEALGWDVRLANVTAGVPMLSIARDTLAGVPYGSGATIGFTPAPSPFVSTNWPSGARWGATKDFTERTGSPIGANEDGRILTMGMNRPLRPGTYTMVAHSYTGTPITCDLMTRGIGEGFTIPVRDLAFAGGVHSGQLTPREAAFYRVVVPSNSPNWKLKLTTTNNGEACLIALRGAIPNVGAAVSMGTVTNLSAGKKLQRVGNEQFLLLPEGGTDSLMPGTYYLAVASEGRFATNIYNIGTGAVDYTLTSIGPAPVRNLGLITSDVIYDTNSLQAAEVQLYQFTVSNALSMELALTSRTGNPVMSLRHNMRFPDPGAFGPNIPPEQYGHDAGEMQGNLVHSTLLVVPNPTNGVYSLAVKARGGLDGVFSNATYVLQINVQGIQDIAFDGGSHTVNGQQSSTWRFFRVDVPPDAVGWDIRLTNVTSGTPRLVVRRDFLPNTLFTTPWSQPHLAFRWPSSNSWAATADWTRRGADVNGVNEDNRVLAMGMGRPLDPGTYYIGVNNLSGSTPMSYSIASRGIGGSYSIPVIDLPFTGGSHTHPGLAPREAAFYRVIVPSNAPSWKVKLTALSGESMLAALWGAAPSVDSVSTSGSVTNGRAMQKLGNEHLLELPVWPGTNAYVMNPGINYLAVISEGLNPANAGRVGGGLSSFTITSVGTLPVHDFGVTGPTDILYSDVLEGGEVKAYQFTKRTGLFGLKVRLEQRVGNPFMSLIQGNRLPDPAAGYQSIPPDYYGTENGVSGPLVNSTLITIPNPTNSIYSFTVKSRMVPATQTFPDSSYTLRIQELGIRDLNFDPSLNTNGQSHIASGDLEDNERTYFRVEVPPTLNGQPVVGWELRLQQSSGMAFVRVRKDQLPNDSVFNLMPFTPSTGIIVPPFLTNGTWYVEVKGSNSTSFTLTSSHITLERPPFLMPGVDVPGGSPGVTPPEFGDTGVDEQGNPVPPDQSLFLEQGTLHYYAVRVPTNNYGLLRVQLQAISGNPDLYARTNFPPTLHHNYLGGSGSVFDRSMVLTATEYANWVPLDAKTEARLTPGLWYVVVHAAGNANARYRLVFSTGTITDVPIHGPVSPVQAVASGDWRYYRVVMPNVVPVNFNVSFSQISGDVAMYVRDTVPPGNGATPNYYDVKTWYTDQRNAVTNANYDAPGTYNFASPPVRVGGTYYFGFRAVSDATFTMQVTTNGGPAYDVPLIAFYGGTATTNLGPFGSALFRIDVPADGTRWKHTSVHTTNVQLALENGTYPKLTASDDWRSTSANGALNVSLRGGWPWIPNTYFFLLMTNTSSQPQTVTFNMNGKNAQTDDDDNDGILDWWEYFYFGHTAYAAATDPDVDGVSNLDEYLEGTNPNDKTSFRPRLLVNAINGTVARNPNQTNFALGDSVTLTAAASNGYAFAGWSGSATGLTNPLTLLMNTNKTITAIFRLAGDDWIIAYALTGATATATANNGAYSKEAGEPNHAGNTGGRSVWWKWTAPFSGQTTVRTLGSTFATTLGVYTGTVSVSNLTVVTSDYNSLGSTNRSRVIFDAAAGTLYSIAVDGFNGAAGTIQLSLSSVSNLRLVSVVSLPNGSTQVNGLGAPNTTYTIDASTNLVNWAPFGTATSDGAGAFSFTDTDAPNAQTRFYRGRN